MRFLVSKFLLILFTFLVRESSAQYTKGLKIGDKVPDLVFSNTENFGKDTVRLSELKGELFIIDIWNKWCSNCIDGFPKNEELQNKFKGKVQFILLTTNTREDFEILKSKSKKVRSSKLPFVFNDTLVDQLFPHLGVPHHVWIDSTFTVRAVTNQYGTNEANLKEFFLTGGTSNVRRKDSDLMDFNSEVPLIYEGNGRLIKLVESYSLFMNNIQDYSSSNALGNYFNSNGNIDDLGVKFVNSSVSDFLIFVFGNTEIDFDFPGGEHFVFPRTQDGNAINVFLRDYTFCYEMMLPGRYRDSSSEVKKDAIKRRIIRDMEDKFGFVFSVERRVIKCLDLVSVGKVDVSPIKREDEAFLEENNGSWVLKNVPMEILPDMLHDILDLKESIVNKTNLKGIMDMNIKLVNSNLVVMNEELRKYKLQLVPSNVVKNVTVVKKQSRY